MTRRKLFFGTANAHKLAEIRTALGGSFEVLSFNDLPRVPVVEETETTLEGNAALKARAFYELSGIPCFADDTGLEVDALGGRPGVYSSRYAGKDGNAEANMGKLLAELKGVKERSAKFRTVIAFYDGKEISLFEGELKGSIAESPSGSGGFGYDPVFVPEGSDRSLGMYSPEEKNAVSHRSRAVKKLADFLKHE